ncbi:hypothetical protein SAMN05216474_2569 [Lishizhenia tianjinensis]|uniref:Methyltransferase domain-containing protein n=1 Tax=Lishizhenia tianjinensis TaxID=477690 RepID=A0A1I7B5D3_9FLAO|nr:hypothetical protein [Lishizhenia tianjinensis]SFT82399.1 hypothetical protein SAMN05216474_2569 [Lishizhenia tianjinensis]
MKRIHLFEFEDLHFFPEFLRNSMTNYLNAFHRVIKTKNDLSLVVKKALKISKATHIQDLCSGAGGPMPDVLREIQKDKEFEHLQLTLSDLYPNQQALKKFEAVNDINYLSSPVNAASIPKQENTLVTMICSMHHMPPKVAKEILLNAQHNNQCICVYEISDNSYPIVLFPINFLIGLIMPFFVTPFVKNITWHQILFTYFIPLLPILISWDGTVSNVRTYTKSDWQELMGNDLSEKYTWEIETVGDKMKKIYVLGYPKAN